MNQIKQFLITPAGGKRLIAKAMLKHASLKKALNSGTVVIIAGTTNGYIAEEILSDIGQDDDFSRRRFFRGIVLPPSMDITSDGRLPDSNDFPGDVVIKNGKWQIGKTIFDVVDELNDGDVILKGVNALNLSLNQAGIYIGHPEGGTIGAALQAHIGRRVKLILPVGLEKRVFEDINKIANKLNQPGVRGARMLPTPGEIFTEIHAIKLLTGANVEIIASGGVSGAEGSVWLAITGDDKQIKSAGKIIRSISKEPNFNL